MTTLFISFSLTFPLDEKSCSKSKCQFNVHFLHCTSVYLRKNMWQICILTREKVPAKLHFKYRMDMKRYRNKVKIKDCKKTTLHQQKIKSRCMVVFLLSFIHSLFLYFFPYLKRAFAKLFPSFFSFLGGVLSQLPTRTHFKIVFAHHPQIPYHTADQRAFLFWRRTLLALETDTSVLETNALKTCI